MSPTVPKKYFGWSLIYQDSVRGSQGCGELLQLWLQAGEIFFCLFLPLLFVFYPTQRFNCMPISFVTKFCARILLNDQHVTYTKVRQLKVSYCVFCPSSSSPSSSASSVSSASSSASSTPGFLLRLLKSSSAEESHRHQLGCLLRFLNHHQPSKKGGLLRLPYSSSAKKSHKPQSWNLRKQRRFAACSRCGG